MLQIIMHTISNPRTDDSKWENMEGCHMCGSVTSAYIKLDIYQDHSRIAKNIRMCKRCLCKGELLINDTILRPNS